MRSTFFGLNTAFSGLSAQRRLLDNTSHNIANVATPGYSRQRVEIQASPAFPWPGLSRPGGPGQIGTGVEPIAHVRLRDPFAADVDPLLPGQVAFYLTTGVSGSTESGLDSDSSGAPRPNDNPCP